MVENNLYNKIYLIWIGMKFLFLSFIPEEG